jgi:hypothetical protein
VTHPEGADEPAEAALHGSLDGSLISSEAPSAQLNVEVPHTARIYDYALGGKTNYPADRQAAEQALAVFPSARVAAQQNRAFLHRAVRFLTEAGIDQFLDVGTGIPTSPNLHEVAQSINPAARVVYVDNDPIVLVHARALLASSSQGRTTYLAADLRRPTDILASTTLAETLDLSRPVALSLVAVLHFFPDATGPAAIVRELMAVLPVDSYLVLSHGTADLAPEESRRLTDVYKQSGIPIQSRSRAEIGALVPTSLEIVEPGIELVHRWHPDADPDLYADADISLYGLVARKSPEGGAPDHG